MIVVIVLVHSLNDGKLPDHVNTNLHRTCASWTDTNVLYDLIFALIN